MASMDVQEVEPMVDQAPDFEEPFVGQRQVSSRGKRIALGVLSVLVATSLVLLFPVRAHPSLSAARVSQVMQADTEVFDSCPNSKNITTATEVCCPLQGFVKLGYHCAVHLTLEGGSVVTTEWAHAVMCHPGTDLKNGPCEDPSVWSTVEFPHAVSGWTVGQLMSWARSPDFCNCQYYSRDAYNKLTGEDIGLYQPLGASLFCGISSSSSR
mmetsp:Transcript_2472/g.6986  ORF Transcript_2472/g.6986 Transcript_2472/m.6986 type:complete len:211 (-) Transcript_2472:122-754(-)